MACHLRRTAAAPQSMLSSDSGPLNTRKTSALLLQAKQAKQANVRGHLLPRLVPHIAWPTSDGREMLS